MNYDFKVLEQKSKEIQDWLSKEFMSVRTGRATPALLDSLQVKAYGSRMRLNQLAHISIEDARTLRIAPYDASQIKDIEQEMIRSDLGISVSTDESGLRASFPELTSERRSQLMKLIHEKLEHAKISLRKLRDETWDDIQKKEKTKELSEDDKFKAKNEMQKSIDSATNALEEITQKKEREISE